MGQQILFMFVQPLLKDYRIVLSTLFLSIICSSISYISLILATHYPVNKTLLCTHSSWPMNRTSSIIVATLFASANPCLLFRIFAFHPKLKRESAFLLFILLHSIVEITAKKRKERPAHFQSGMLFSRVGLGIWLLFIDCYCPLLPFSDCFIFERSAQGKITLYHLCFPATELRNSSAPWETVWLLEFGDKQSRKQLLRCPQI